MHLSIKDIVIIAACISIVFVQEQLLSFLPNIQLTILLLILYSKKLGLIKTIIIVIIHSFLDCLVTGSLNLYYFPFMLMGWLLIPVIINLFFRKTESVITLSIMGIVFALLYSWAYIIPNVLIPNESISNVGLINYLAADITFEIILASSSFLSILWLYNPCSKVFDKILKDVYK
ncbi:MAG: hypothetical protein E7183_01945 [Erysipelotrichaceae bacterium]|nr:hypothetical protein [Erysipelotrichaceae bacterium]